MRKGKLLGEFIIRNIVERAVKTQTTKKMRINGVGWLGWFISEDQTVVSDPVQTLHSVISTWTSS